MDQLFALSVIKASLSKLIVSDEVVNGNVNILTKKEYIVEFANFLKNDLRIQFNMLSDLFAVDYPKRAERIEVIYNFYSVKNNFRVFVKARSEKDADDYPSLAALYSSADWFEREIYDMFGLKFKDHPDLKRILNPDDWIGHPLLKDYPLRQRPPLQDMAVDFEAPGYIDIDKIGLIDRK